jgi:arginyl-tRNA synthetase
LKNRIEKLGRTTRSPRCPRARSASGPPPDPAIERSRDVATRRLRDRRRDAASPSAARTNPRELAARRSSRLCRRDRWSRKTEIAGPGFINFFMTPGAWQAEMSRVLAEGAALRAQRRRRRQQAIVEFVSANPTGPLHVGHGRHAAFGATVANLLEADGWRVHREYYVNDAGRQMDILAASVWLRYLELCGETLPFPANGYRGDYVRPVAARLRSEHGDALRRPAGPVLSGMPPDEGTGGDKDQYVDAVIARAQELPRRRLPHVFARGARGHPRRHPGRPRRVRRELRPLVLRAGARRRPGRRADRPRAPAPARARARVRAGRRDLVPRAPLFGDEKDRVVVRANGQKTYFASDIAYHLDKRERGFELLLDDPRRRPPRLRRARARRARGHGRAAGIARSSHGAVRHALEEAARKVAMGKREAQFVTLRELRGEVGNDAARFIYVMRSNDQPLDFDLELAKKQSNDNPVYYVQYAHARIASVLKLGARARSAVRPRRRASRRSTRSGSPRSSRSCARFRAGPSRRPGRGAQGPAPRRALPARARAGLPCLLRSASVHRGRSADAERAPRADRRGAPGAPERPRDPRRVGTGINVMGRPRLQAQPRTARGFLGLDRPLHRARRGPRGRARALLLRPARPQAPDAAEKAPAAAEPASSRESADEEQSDKYDFYQMLPNFEVVVPEKEVVMPRDAPEPADKTGAYVLQAGSYRKFEDADRVRAQLALQGIESNVQRVAIDNDTWHRVRIGPISDPKELNRVRERLKEAEVDFLVVRVGE